MPTMHVTAVLEGREQPYEVTIQSDKEIKWLIEDSRRYARFWTDDFTQELQFKNFLVLRFTLDESPRQG